MMQKTILIIVIFFIIVSLLFGGCTASATPTTTAATQTTTTTTTPPTTTMTPTINTTSADIKVTSLDVTPIVAEPGMPVSIEVKVMNTGGTEGSQTLGLTVTGVGEEVKDVTAAPGASKTGTFTLVKDSSGLYEIESVGWTKSVTRR